MSSVTEPLTATLPLTVLNDEEKMSIERAAAKEGISMSRFIVERALTAAKRVLS